MLAEHLLHRMQRAVGLGEALDRDHRGAVRLQRQHGAGLRRDAVDDARRRRRTGWCRSRHACRSAPAFRAAVRPAACGLRPRPCAACRSPSGLPEASRNPSLVAVWGGVWSSRPRGGQAGAATPERYRFWAKSEPLKSRGSSRDLRQSVGGAIATVQACRVATFAKAKEGFPGDSREPAVVRNDLQLMHRGSTRPASARLHRITGSARKDHRSFLQTYRGHASRHRLPSMQRHNRPPLRTLRGASP